MVRRTFAALFASAAGAAALIASPVTARAVPVQFIGNNTPIQFVTLSTPNTTIQEGQNAFVKAQATLTDPAASVRLLGGGGGAFFSADFAPALNVSVCGTNGTWSSQAFSIDAGGAFHEVWSPMTPTLKVDGIMTLPTGQANASVTAALACVGGQASGAFSAFWATTHYVGSYTFNGGGGDFTVTGLNWSSSDPGIAAVDNRGVVTGVSQGDAVITATYGSLCWQTTPNTPQCDGSISGTITIHVEPEDGGGGGGGGNGPFMTAGPDQTLECSSHAGAQATLAGQIFFDPETPLTYTWSGPFGTAAGLSPTVTVPLGSHTLTFTISDGTQSASDDTGVTVVDTAAPAISAASASPAAIWPPNGRMKPATIQVSAADVCDPQLDCRITGVSGDDGASPSDWEITGPLTVSLRALRSGDGSGRTYTVTVECRDDSGNTATKTVAIVVPHDQR